MNLLDAQEKRGATSRMGAARPADDGLSTALDAFAGLAPLRRWIAWKAEQRNGRPTKVPYSPVTKGFAKSTDPNTWATLKEASQFADQIGASGLGVMLGWVPELNSRLGGIDLDACRDPATGELTPWAQKIITGFGSYAEVSPSDSGVKILAWGAPGEVPRSEVPMKTPPINGKAAEVGVYVERRYFTVTGRILDGVPDEIRDCGETGGPWDRMVQMLREAGPKDKPSRVNGKPTGTDRLSPRFLEVLKSDAGIQKLWALGAGDGGDRSRSDASLAVALARVGLSDPEIEAAIRRYPMGQVSQEAGSLGFDAERQISRLLGLASTGRHPNGEGSEGGSPSLRLKSLAERWDFELEDFLDPNPFLLRPSEAGMGPDLDRQLGGGLSPGQTVALVSAGAGVGKTALLHQFVDGVADRNAEVYLRASERDTEPEIVPVVLVSEMTVRDLTIRSLARRAGVEGTILRDPKGPLGCRPLLDGLTYGQDALAQARDAAEKAREAALFIVPVEKGVQITAETLGEVAQEARRSWESQGCQVPTVLLVVDPLHRILDPTRPEVESTGMALQALMGIAQRERAIVLFSSDTTKAAAAGRGTLGSQAKEQVLAQQVEAAFRGSYQLLHIPDVALGLVTLRADDEGLSDEDRRRLELEPEGTIYAEVINAKSRWDKSGRRAAYFLDPAMFRYRPTTSRAMPGAGSLEERVRRYVTRWPGCSQAEIRRSVTGRTDAIRDAITSLLKAGELVDRGSDGRMKLHPAETR